MIQSASQPDALLGWMGSLADPTRLRLLRLLERHDLGVVDLCDVLQLPQSTVSRHLKVLGDERWVRGTRRGATHQYRMILDELDEPARRLWMLAREQTGDWATVRQDELRLTRRLRQRHNESQAFFAGAAGQWDRLRGELYGENFGLEAMLALLPSDYVVADLGCGTGPITARLAEHVGRVIAVDNSAEMLKAARRRVGELKNAELRRGDLESLPIADAACDAALLVLALTYVADPAPVVAEMSRILKPGGLGVVVDLLPHDRDDFRRQLGQQHRGISQEQIKQWMGASGMEASVRPLSPEPHAKGPALFLAKGTRAFMPIAHNTRKEK